MRFKIVIFLRELGSIARKTGVYILECIYNTRGFEHGADTTIAKKVHFKMCIRRLHLDVHRPILATYYRQTQNVLVPLHCYPCPHSLAPLLHQTWHATPGHQF